VYAKEESETTQRLSRHPGRRANREKTIKQGELLRKEKESGRSQKKSHRPKKMTRFIRQRPEAAKTIEPVKGGSRPGTALRISQRKCKKALTRVRKLKHTICCGKTSREGDLPIRIGNNQYLWGSRKEGGIGALIGTL